MANNLVITISRQFGSNGRHIGGALAKKLNLKYYDKELIKIAAKENGLSEKLFEKADEMPSNSFLYTLSLNSRSYNPTLNYMECLTNDKLFLMQAKVIKELANESPCLIVGRCADYILRGKPNCFNIFIHASEEYRIKHVMLENEIDRQAAIDMIKKVGKKRASYYNYYSDVEWGDARNYDLTLDVTDLKTETAVNILANYINTVKENNT